jgi:hypothetical protein
MTDFTQIETKIAELTELISKTTALINDSKVCSSDITKSLIASAVKKYIIAISDFKIENGYYVCQICGHQEAVPGSAPTKTATKTKQGKTPDKSTDKIISLIVFAALAFLALIALFKNYGINLGGGNLQGVQLVFFLCDICCLIDLLGLLVASLATIYDRKEMKGAKTFFFVLYAFARLMKTIYRGVVYRFAFTALLYDIFYIALVWVAIYGLKKWIKNSK